MGGESKNRKAGEGKDFLRLLIALNYGFFILFLIYWLGTYLKMLGMIHQEACDC